MPIYNSNQMNEEGAWKLRHLLIADRIISESDSIEFLIGLEVSDKLNEAIICTDTKIIVHYLELDLYGPNKKTIKEYPYSAITGVSKKGMIFIKVILLLVGNVSVTIKNPMPTHFATALIDFINSKIEQQKQANNNTTFSSPQNSATRESMEASAADEIAKFHALKEQGAISDEEYNAKKKQLLGL